MSYFGIILASLTWISLSRYVRSEGNCGGCGTDSVNDYLSVTISNIRTTEHGLINEPVYSFNGNWEAVEECYQGSAYYIKTDVYNLVYEVDETFYLLYVPSNSRWEIRKASFSTAWAYCNKEDIESCTNLWYVEDGYNSYAGSIAYTLDNSVSTVGSTDSSCGQAGVIETTPAPTEYTGCLSNADDCVIGSDFWYSGLNVYWQVKGCVNNEAWYEAIGGDYNWALFYGGDNKWLISFEASETQTSSNAVAYCGANVGSNFLNCDGNWYITFSQDENGAMSSTSNNNCESAISDNSGGRDDTEDDEDASIVPYGYETETSDGNDDNENELEWWAWLLIGIAILVVLVGIIIISVKFCRTNKTVKYGRSSGDKDAYLLEKE